jgi:hypothetical protein
MNTTSSNLLTSCWMASHLSGVYLLSFCLIGLYDRSTPNFCSITSLEISGISDIFHAKTLKLSRRKVISVNSYLGSRLSLIRSFLSGFLGSTSTCLSSVCRVPEDAIVPDVKACDFKYQHLLALIISRTARYLQIDAANRGG